MKKTPKNAKIFSCEICDFKCCKQSDYDRHLLTATDIYNLYEATHKYENELSRGIGHVKHIRRKHDPLYDEQCNKLAKASQLIDKGNSIALKIGLKQLEDAERLSSSVDHRTMPVNQPRKASW